MNEYPVSVEKRMPVFDQPGRWRGQIARSIAVVVLVLMLAIGAGAPFREVLIWTGACGLLTLAIDVSLGLRIVQFAVEKTFHIDVNQDGHIGQPIVNQSLVQIDPGRWRMLQVPGDPETLRQFYLTALDGGSLSYRTWRGRFLDHNKVDQFPKVRHALVGAGMMREKGTGGLELTAEGRLWMEAEVYSPTHTGVPQLPAGHDAHTVTQGVGG